MARGFRWGDADVQGEGSVWGIVSAVASVWVWGASGCRGKGTLQGGPGKMVEAWQACLGTEDSVEGSGPWGSLVGWSRCRGGG